MVEDRTQQQSVTIAVNKLESVFARAKFQMALFAERYYIWKVDFSDKETPTRSMMMSAKEERDPIYQARKEYFEQVEFLRPEVRVMGLTKGGVRL